MRVCDAVVSNDLRPCKVDRGGRLGSPHVPGLGWWNRRPETRPQPAAVALHRFNALRTRRRTRSLCLVPCAAHARPQHSTADSPHRPWRHRFNIREDEVLGSLHVPSQGKVDERWREFMRFQVRGEGEGAGARGGSCLGLVSGWGWWQHMELWPVCLLECVFVFRVGGWWDEGGHWRRSLCGALYDEQEWLLVRRWTLCE